MNQPVIYLVRHGKTILNAGADSPDRIRGWMNVPLDEIGEQQAVQVSKFFKDKDISTIYTSDLDRALVVAEEISKVTKAPVEKSQDWRPWNLGDFQGKSSKDAAVQLKSKYVKHPDIKVPGGESFNDFSDRYLTALKSLMLEVLEHKQPVVIVTHYRNCKLAEAWIAAGMGDYIRMSVFFTDGVQTADVIELQPTDNKWKFNLVKDTGVESEFTAKT